MSIAGSDSAHESSQRIDAAPKRLGRPADAIKRQRILDAAAHSFFEAGFAATSIEQVAAMAGVSKVTIYNHFTDKRGLFTAAVEGECEKMRSYLSLDDMPHGCLRNYLTAFADCVADFLARPEIIQFKRRIAAETESNPEIGRAFLEAGPWRLKQAFSDYLGQAAARGDLAIADTGIAAEQFMALVLGLSDLETRFGVEGMDRDRQRRIAGAVSMFLATYAPQPAGTK